MNLCGEQLYFLRGEDAPRIRTKADSIAYVGFEYGFAAVFTNNGIC